jgi:hypothetical protein
MVWKLLWLILRAVPAVVWKTEENHDKHHSDVSKNKEPN